MMEYAATQYMHSDFTAWYLAFWHYDEMIRMMLMQYGG